MIPLRPAFRNRAEAGERLAERILDAGIEPSVVAGIPRGGVAVALPIATSLEKTLLVLCATKLRASFAPELAFGALDEDGVSLLDEATIARLGLSAEDIEESKEKAGSTLRGRIARYGRRRLTGDLKGASVLLVDDGLATGLTMRSAVQFSRRHGASEVIVAVPCASTEAALTFEREANRFVSLIVDERFVSVGSYYEEFDPVTDEQVAAILEESRPSVRVDRRSRGPADEGGRRYP